MTTSFSATTPAALLFALAASLLTPPVALANEELVRIEHAGRSRVAIVVMPDSLPDEKSPSQPLPLVFAFHGGGGRAQQFREYAGLDSVATREAFIVVYPEGTSRSGIVSGRLHTWNSGRCCGHANSEGVDDVGYVIALLDQLSKQRAIDPQRVYATGHSNGAMMSYRLAAEASDRIAAIAPVGGAMLLDDFAPSRPVPVLHIHSIDDPRALYEGGLGPPFPLTNHRVLHNGVESELARWRVLHGCAEESRIAEQREAPPDRADAGHRAERIVWTPCASGGAVELWRLSGPGHGWPGDASLATRRGRFRTRTIGPPSAVIDSAEEAWRFFLRHRLDPGSGGGAKAPK